MTLNFLTGNWDVLTNTKTKPTNLTNLIQDCLCSLTGSNNRIRESPSSKYLTCTSDKRNEKQISAAGRAHKSWAHRSCQDLSIANLLSVKTIITGSSLTEKNIFSSGLQDIETDVFVTQT